MDHPGLAAYLEHSDGRNGDSGAIGTRCGDEVFVRIEHANSIPIPLAGLDVGIDVAVAFDVCGPPDRFETGSIIALEHHHMGAVNGWSGPLAAHLGQPVGVEYTAAAKS